MERPVLTVARGKGRTHRTPDGSAIDHTQQKVIGQQAQTSTARCP